MTDWLDTLRILAWVLGPSVAVLALSAWGIGSLWYAAIAYLTIGVVFAVSWALRGADHKFGYWPAASSVFLWPTWVVLWVLLKLEEVKRGN